MEDTPQGADAGSRNADIQDGKWFAVWGYLNVLCFVPLLLKKNNAFAQFHGKQALVLFIIEIAACMMKLVPVLGEFVFTVVFVACVCLSLYGIIKVLMDEWWEMPFIHDIASRINL